MRTILLNLPWNENGRLGVRAGSRWPFTSEPEKDGRIHYIPFPFFLAYATALLKKENKDVKLIDAIAEGIQEQQLICGIESFNPDLIVIEVSTPSFKNDLRIACDIHRNLSGSQIAICGPHASVFPEEILSKYDFIDYILIGEYEYTLLDLVNYLETNLSLESILGLAYRYGSKVLVNNNRPAIDNLDNLPWPERKEVPIYKYNDGFAGLPYPNVQMLSSRGCPFQCTYCLWPQTMYKEHRYRKRNPVNVVDEMESLIREFGFKAIYFDDDIFNLDRNHVLDICDEIKKRNIHILWAVMARADLMEEDLLLTMASCGLYAIKYGVESADQNILDSCKKNANLDKIRRVIKFTKSLCIKVHLTFCLGLPGESAHTINKIVDFIQDVNPDTTQFSYATPFPGTVLFESLEKKGYLSSKDWSDYDGNHKCIVCTQELSLEDLEKARAFLNNKFNPSLECQKFP